MAIQMDFQMTCQEIFYYFYLQRGDVEFDILMFTVVICRLSFSFFFLKKRVFGFKLATNIHFGLTERISKSKFSTYAKDEPR